MSGRESHLRVEGSGSVGVASVTAALHLAAARPSDGAGSSLVARWRLAAAPYLAAAPLVAAPSPVNPAASPVNPPHHRRHRLARLAGL